MGFSFKNLFKKKAVELDEKEFAKAKAEARDFGDAVADTVAKTTGKPFAGRKMDGVVFDEADGIKQKPRQMKSRKRNED